LIDRSIDLSIYLSIQLLSFFFGNYLTLYVCRLTHPTILVDPYEPRRVLSRVRHCGQAAHQQSISLYVYLYLYLYLSIYPSVSIDPSIHPSSYPSIGLRVNPNIDRYVFIFIFLCPSSPVSVAACSCGFAIVAEHKTLYLSIDR